MTQDEIIEMLRASCDKDRVDPEQNGFWVIVTDELERFAKLVAQHTLTNTDPKSFMSYQHGFEAGRMIERECILDLVDDYAKNNTDLADAIRARGQA